MIRNDNINEQTYMKTKQICYSLTSTRNPISLKAVIGKILDVRYIVSSLKLPIKIFNCTIISSFLFVYWIRYFDTGL